MRAGRKDSLYVGKIIIVVNGRKTIHFHRTIYGTIIRIYHFHNTEMCCWHHCTARNRLPAKNLYKWMHNLYPMWIRASLVRKMTTVYFDYTEASAYHFEKEWNGNESEDPLHPRWDMHFQYYILDFDWVDTGNTKTLRHSRPDFWWYYLHRLHDDTHPTLGYFYKRSTHNSFVYAWIDETIVLTSWKVTSRSDW